MKSLVALMLLFHFTNGLEVNTSSLLVCAENYTDISNTTVVGINITLQFCSNEINLDSVLTIANSHSVEVMGIPTTLICKSSNTGIHIYNVIDLVLQDIELISCGSMFKAPSDPTTTTTTWFVSSIYIFNCTDIEIERMNITGSHGNGMTMFDNHGEVLIRESYFKMNKNNQLIDNVTPSGSGLHIVLSYCRPRSLTDNYTCLSGPGNNISQSNYRIEECTFTRNNGSIHFEEEHQLLASGFGRGGGLCVIIDTNSFANTIHVSDCEFTDNSAKWGGALYVVMLGSSRDNSVIITRCRFSNNSCNDLAGGAATIGYQHYNTMSPQNNSVEFHRCKFSENRALYGGGVNFYSSKSTDMPNKMMFRDCNWEGNTADIGAAVSIGPQTWTTFVHDMKIQITFGNCRFVSNTLTHDLHAKMERTSYEKGKGIISIVGYKVSFEGSNDFDSNTDSAIYLTSSDIFFSRYSNTMFTNNAAFEGAGINMIGFSTLLLDNDVAMTFENNSALAAGGAIFQHTYNIRDFFTSESCFIRYNGNLGDVYERNISILFKNNSVGNIRAIPEKYAYGHSIYATTIKPCQKSSGCMSEQPNQVFDCIANFTLKDSDISTATNEMQKRENNSKVWVVPGEQFELPISAMNDLGREITSIYHVSVRNLKSTSNISIDSIYRYLSNKLIKFRGKPYDEAHVELETLDLRAIVYVLNVQIQECPPGYIHNRDKMECECSANTEYRFLGIRKCNEDSFQAKLTQGYWVGYFEKSVKINNYTFGREKYLLHADCPLQQCSSSSHFLPKTTSIEHLDKEVCGESRTGVLCSKCRGGYSAHYHHSGYSCKEKKLCKWGWLLYIVSEIAPITVFFVVVMVLNIKFTDGAVNGFILFVQLSDTMHIRGNGTIQLSRHTLLALEAYRFLTGIFNLNFFAIDSLSFCLWRSASTLDLLAFKYITILYASTLVVIIIVIFKYCHNKRINNILIKIKGESAASVKSTIIHGISGFLVICYSECTRISLLLLTPAPLYGRNESGYFIKSRVSFYDGELDFFHDRHILYALPALFIVLTLGILPPLMLISYPLCYKVLAVLKLNETKFTKLLCTCIPLEKFRPFFDSFQSSFKDDYRFMSGLYFLYRFLTLTTFAFVSHLMSYYILVQVLLAVILAVHALCQPYKKRWHNILDTLLFLNLSVVNAVTLTNYSLSIDNATASYQQYVDIVGTLQIIFLYVPLFYLIIYSLRKCFLYLKKSKFITTLQQFKCRNATTSSECMLNDYSLSISLNAAENRLMLN